MSSSRSTAAIASLPHTRFDGALGAGRSISLPAAARGFSRTSMLFSPCSKRAPGLGRIPADGASSARLCRYLFEDRPRLLDAERPDHESRDQRAGNEQPQKPAEMVRSPRIERAEQGHPAPGAEMPEP